HLGQSFADEVRMAADKSVEPRDLVAGGERRAMAAVQIGHLLLSEVLHREAGADVEGRLIQIGDEQVGLGGIGDRQREARPGAIRLQRAPVVPGAEEAEYLASEGTTE